MAGGNTDQFVLDPQLAGDTVEVMRGACCRVQLMNDANYPWLILVPQRPNLRDFHDLVGDDMLTTVAEIGAASRALQRLYDPVKLNVAALGNVVNQLHFHVVSRRRDDPAWPKPIWGVARRIPYEAAAMEARLNELRDQLKVRERNKDQLIDQRLQELATQKDRPEW